MGFGTKHLSVIVLSLFGLIILYLFLQEIGVETIWQTMRQANPFLFLLALFISFTSLSFFSLTWSKILEGLDIELSFWDSMKTNIAALFVNLTLPTASLSGEATRAYISKKSFRIPLDTTISAVVLHRIFLFLPFLIGGFLSLFGAIFLYKIPIFIIAIFALTFLATISLFIIFLGLSLKLIFFEKFIDSIAIKSSKLVGWRRALKGKSYVLNLSSQLRSSLRMISESKGVLFLTVFYSLAEWFCEFMLNYVVLLSLGVDPGAIAVLLVFSLTVLLQFAPLGIPGMVGIAETVTTYLYTVVGVSLSTAASAAIITRILTFWAPLLLGLVVLILFTKESVTKTS